MRKLTLYLAGPVAILVGALVWTGCGSDSSSPTTASAATYTQIDRLARPAVNEVFATVANNRHQINDEDSPPNDKNQLKNDIDGFLTSPANRSPAIRAVIESVLVPDMLTADLSQ